MTQIIGYVDRTAAFMASDRRLTMMPSGDVVDDNMNKLVRYEHYSEATTVYGYTGAAELDGDETHIWLTKKLMEKGDKNNAKIRDLEREIAAAVGRSGPRGVVPFGLLGVGFVRDPNTATIVPAIHTYTNIINGTVTARFARSFLPPPANGHRLEVVGQPLAGRTEEWLERELASLRTRGSPFTKIVSALVTAIRETADWNEAVGRNILTSVIPEPDPSDPFPDQIIEIAALSDMSTRPTFQYWAEWSDSGTVYGPSFAQPGSGSFGFEARSLKNGRPRQSEPPGPSNAH